jgi:uroporphyrinogen-III synthase
LLERTARDAVLITRPEPGAGETAHRIAAMKLRPVLAPLLSIRHVPAHLPEPASLQAVLAASANAVAALPPSHHALPLLAVGNATADRAREAGFTNVTSAGGDATDLVALALRVCDPGGPAVLLAAGRRQGERLAQDLRQRGFRVLRRTVYEAAPAATLPEPARRALAEGSLRAALFFSAETARTFVDLVGAAGLVGELRGVDALAIGRPAAAALEGLPWRHVRVAIEPNQEAMLALLS